MVADARFDKLSTVRSTIATGLAPVYWLGNAPYEFSDWFAGLFENKQDLQEVRNGMECGIGVKNYNDVKVGDQIEVFQVVEVKREI